MPLILCVSVVSGSDNGPYTFIEGTDANWTFARDPFSDAAPAYLSGWSSNWTSGRSSYIHRIEGGETCADPNGRSVVIMKVADYQNIVGAFTGFNLADVAAIVPAVALVWAVAWLFKRLIAVLRNQI